MQSKWLDETFTYDGSQLRSSFGYSQYGLLGDSIISWKGPCNVHKDNMVDIEDLLSKSEIYSQGMVHFIIELFDQSLPTAVAYQRLFVTVMKDVIFQFLSQAPQSVSAKYYEK